MSKRLVQTMTPAVGHERKVKVYFNSDHDEYTAELFINEVRQKKATYFTDDKQDAIDTGKHMLGGTLRAGLAHLIA